MSNTDSFIEEVSEEVRRDRLFRFFRKYGWIAILAVLGIVGGTAWSEWRASQERFAARELGDLLISSVEKDAIVDRIESLKAISASKSGGQAIRDFLLAAEQVRAGQISEALETLDAISSDGDLPEIYRDIASFKALVLPVDHLSIEERRLSFDSLGQSGGILQLLAIEQLAYIDIEIGDTAAAVEKLRTLYRNVDTGANLRQRARQAIIALGETVDQQLTSE
ncbi:MAG: hypothetical protein OXC62_10005 [Aestuariivita sp.]|nr:hypothetical protein [Aestuariivita sp.]